MPVRGRSKSCAEHGGRPDWDHRQDGAAELQVGARPQRCTYSSPEVSSADPIWQLQARAGLDRKSTRLNSSHVSESRMPSSA